MTTIIDINLLSSPIGEDQPAGVDIREAGDAQQLYYQLKDLRSEARDIERQMSRGYEQKDPMPLWQEVINSSQTILEKYSKDFEVVAWLIEGLVRKHQFIGLQEGLLLLNRLVDQYWEQMHPLADDDEIRLAAIAGLNGYDAPGALHIPLNALPMTGKDSSTVFAFWEYQQAIDASRITDAEKQAQRAATLGFDLEKINRSRDESSEDFYRSLQEDLYGSIQAFNRTKQLIDEKSERYSLPSSFIDSVLSDFQSHIHFLLKDSKFPIMTFDQPVIGEEDRVREAEPTKISSSIKNSKKISTRDEALKQINRVAEYFAATEPHSPLPYLLRRAVHWGNLPLHELLNELISDESARQSVFNLTGIEN